MQVINPYDIEVTVDAEGWKAIQMRGDEHRFTKIPVRTAGDGPEKKIILLLYGNGIGDMVHSMPAIAAKIAEGFEVSVLCETPLAPFYERMGATAIPTDSANVGFIPDHKSEYGAFYSLRHWCIAHDETSRGESHIDRFQQLAGYIDTTLPDTFDWRPYLLNDADAQMGVKDYTELGLTNRPKSEHPYLVLGMQASSRQREYPNAIGLKTALAARHIRWREIGRQDWYSREYPDAEEMPITEIPHAIDRAEAVVAVDSGILAIALALGIPTVALMGPTEEKIIVEQFRRYRPEAHVITVRSTPGSTASHNACQRPCNFMGDRGFGVRGKCTRIPEADCMKEIAPDAVLESLDRLLTIPLALVP